MAPLAGASRRVAQHEAKCSPRDSANREKEARSGGCGMWWEMLGAPRYSDGYGRSSYRGVKVYERGDRACENGVIVAPLSNGLRWITLLDTAGICASVVRA